MSVIELNGFGGPEVLTPGTRSVPVPADDEVLIRVTAAGVNGPDLVQRRGHYPPPKGASDLLGLEVSGEVVSVGRDQDLWRPGDKVCALVNGGGYAEFVLAKAEHCLVIPEGLDEIDAAGLPETFFTVWSNVFQDQTIPENGNFLVHGGAGGIGSTAIQLAAAMGLTVFTTVESDSAAEFARSLGASRTINIKEEDFVEVCREAGGADIILDIIGGDYVARNIKASRHDARIIQIAFNAGSKIEIDLMPVMLKRIHYTGSTLRSRPEAFKSKVARSLQKEVWPLIASRRVRPVTYKVLPLS
ncbi:MAG: NAD(P)H-quinone oxidoreductase [Methyloceanibacter sp.]